MLRVILVSIFLWTIGACITLKDCPDDLDRDQYLAVFADKCYYFYSNLRKEYDDAQAVCQQHGGDLASVKTSAVNDFIWGKLKKYKFIVDVWIGLSDQNNEGVYLWRDGSEMSYVHFESGAGTNTNFLDSSKYYQDCVAMRATTGEWADSECTNSVFYDNHDAFVCEYSPKPDVTSITIHNAAKEDCPSTINRDIYLQVLDNTCYYFYVNTRLEFSLAQTMCENHGGNLVTIKTKRIETFIWKALKSVYEVKGLAWIGLKFVVNRAKFVWVDGSIADYKYFGPSSGIEGVCIAMDTQSGKWLKSTCDDNFFQNRHEHFVCEFPVTARPRTTTKFETTTTSTSPAPTVTATATNTTSPLPPITNTTTTASTTFETTTTASISPVSRITDISTNNTSTLLPTTSTTTTPSSITTTSTTIPSTTTTTTATTPITTKTSLSSTTTATNTHDPTTTIIPTATTNSKNTTTTYTPTQPSTTTTTTNQRSTRHPIVSTKSTSLTSPAANTNTTTTTATTAAKPTTPSGVFPKKTTAKRPTLCPEKCSFDCGSHGIIVDIVDGCMGKKTIVNFNESSATLIKVKLPDTARLSSRNKMKRIA